MISLVQFKLFSLFSTFSVFASVGFTFYVFGCLSESKIKTLFSSFVCAWPNGPYGTWCDWIRTKGIDEEFYLFDRRDFKTLLIQIANNKMHSRIIYSNFQWFSSFSLFLFLCLFFRVAPISFLVACKSFACWTIW